MQEYVEDNPITFNDIPRVMSDIQRTRKKTAKFG